MARVTFTRKNDGFRVANQELLKNPYGPPVILGHKVIFMKLISRTMDPFTISIVFKLLGAHSHSVLKKVLKEQFLFILLQFLKVLYKPFGCQTKVYVPIPAL